MTDEPAFAPPRRHPLPVPLSAVEGVVFPAPVGGMQAVTLAALQQLDHTQYLPPDEMRARQFRQIALLARHAAHTLPFWRARFAAAGFDPAAEITAESWARLPILTRAEAFAAGRALHCTALPKAHGEVTTDRTSGSTGMVLQVKRSALAVFYWNVFTLREEVWHARDLSGKLASIRLNWSKPADATGFHETAYDNWGPPVAAIWPTGKAALLDIRCTIAEQAEWLARQAPDHLVSFGVNLLHLARHCMAHGIAVPTLKTIRSQGEVVSEAARAACRAAWGADIVDMYSAVEVGYLALQCPEHPHYHVQSESALIEILDAEGRPCAPGETGRVVVTPLHNFAMPLFRYDLGDLAEVGGPCACGRTLPVIARILGRARDILVLPSGERRFPYFGQNAMAAYPGVIQHQMIQKTPGNLEIRLVARAPLSGEDEGRLRAAIRASLGYDFDIAIVYCDAIERSAGGKFVEFRSEVVPSG